MKLRSIYSLLLALAVVASSCSAIMGDEVARMTINKVTTDSLNQHVGEATLKLDAGDQLAIWSEMDMHYEGELQLRFIMEMEKDGQEYGGFDFDPTDNSMTVGEVRTHVQNKTNWRFKGRSAKLKIDESGTYTFKAILVTSPNPSLQLDKAELVLRQ